MPHVLPSQTSPARTYAAVALFIVVYLGVMVFIFAPKDMISAQSPTALLSTD